MEEQLERYSFSRLSAYHGCLINFIGTYIFKLEQSENALGQFGSYVHNLLFRYVTGELEIYDLLTEFENGYEDNVTEEFPTLRNGKSMGDAYYEDAYNYFSTFSGFGDYKVLAAEEQFEIQIENFIFNGFIDLILEDADGEITVMDHKSKKSFADEQEEKHYRRQLYLYSAYIFKKYGKYPKELKFNMFRTQDMKTYEFNKDDFDEAMEWTISTVDKIRQLYLNFDFFFCYNLCGTPNCQIKKDIGYCTYLKEYIKNAKKLQKEAMSDV